MRKVAFVLCLIAFGIQSFMVGRMAQVQGSLADPWVLLNMAGLVVGFVALGLLGRIHEH